MNILVLADKFNKGGLETHIDTYHEALKNHHKFIYAFNNYEDNGYLNGAIIYKDFNFTWNSTIEEFCDDVKRLMEIINNHKIDVIHVHPFYAFFPALFVANLTNTKIVYTYHGRSSINFTGMDNDSILFDFGIENTLQKIFCVSENAIDWFNSFNRKQAVFLPNIIDDKKYKKHTVKTNKHWALISRLDADKITEIIEFLKYLPNLDINHVDIYGDGSKKKELEQLVVSLKLNDIVEFKGYDSNLNDTLKEYTGIIGLGRVVLESLAMNYPTMIVGYGKVYDIVDEKIYKELYKLNFVPTEMQQATIEELNEKIKQINKGKYKNYQLRELVIDDIGLKNVKKYITHLNNINPISLDIYMIRFIKK